MSVRFPPKNGTSSIKCAGSWAVKRAALSELSHQEPAWRYAGRLAKLEPELMLYGSSEDPEGL